MVEAFDTEMRAVRERGLPVAIHTVQGGSTAVDAVELERRGYLGPDFLIAHFLAGKQHPDGAWLSESYRPPLEASPFSVTALALRALQLYGPPGRREEMDERIARAAQWLEDHAPETNEDRCLRLLGLAWSNHDTSVPARELLAEQREDGSWAQLATFAGDAYATGQALVALNQAAGVPWTDPAMEAGIAWLLRHHPELSEAQICKLLGTTKATVQAVRDRTHWKSQEIRPRDPVLLGLCQQLELDEAVARAKAEHAAKAEGGQHKAA